jgi:hypothetical protein
MTKYHGFHIPNAKIEKRVALLPYLAFVPPWGLLRPRIAQTQALLGQLCGLRVEAHLFSAEGEIIAPSLLAGVTANMKSTTSMRIKKLLEGD